MVYMFHNPETKSALGPDFANSLSSEFLSSVSHIHFADSDCISEQLHFPPSSGSANIDAAERVLEGRGLSVAWDLFGWPAPRRTFSLEMARYRQAVTRISKFVPLTPDDGEK